jgi:hypothetical protein
LAQFDRAAGEKSCRGGSPVRGGRRGLPGGPGVSARERDGQHTNSALVRTRPWDGFGTGPDCFPRPFSLFFISFPFSFSDFCSI